MASFATTTRAYEPIWLNAVYSGLDAFQSDIYQGELEYRLVFQDPANLRLDLWKPQPLAPQGQTATHRREAVIAMGRAGSLAPIDWLIDALADDAITVRRAAVRSLIKRGEAAVSKLIEAADSQNSLVREGALRSLCRISSEASLLHLLNGVEGETGELQYEIIQSLGSRRDARAVPVLMRLLLDPNFTDNNYTTDALIKIGKPAVEPLIAAFEGPGFSRRAQIIPCLYRIRDQRALPVLIQGLSDDSAPVRRLSAYGLGRMKVTATVDDLAGLLDDEVEAVRAAAMEALVKIGPPAKRRLLMIAQDEREDTTLRERTRAVLHRIRA